MANKLYISYWPKAFGMAKLIRECIEEKTGIHMWLSNDVRYAHINYGNSDMNSEMNSPEFIHTCVRKARFSNFLHQNGFEDTPIFRRGIPGEFPCLVRESLSSFGSYGCHVIKDIDNYRAEGLMNHPEYYWTKFVVTSCEYRIHVLGGKFVRVMKKVPLVPEQEMPLRVSYNEYHYSPRSMFREWDKPNFNALEEKLCPILSAGKFYALDVGYIKEQNKLFVFEANSAPGLTGKGTASLYADYFIKELGLKVVANTEATDGTILRAEQDSQGVAIPRS